MDPELIEVVQYMKDQGVKKFAYENAGRRVEVEFPVTTPAVGLAVSEDLQVTIEDEDEDLLYYST